ncbi:MAG: hypothetical protein ACE5IM_00715, partial [Nitrospinota bacterium]
WEALEIPAFNYVIRTVPVSEEGAPHYVWHVEIVPRVTTPAGFELGSGISINASAPEKDAPLLRGAIEARASGA